MCVLREVLDPRFVERDRVCTSYSPSSTTVTIFFLFMRMAITAAPVRSDNTRADSISGP
jgi:hypothetical protein